MTRTDYERELDAWLADMKREALRQFDVGLDPPLCLGAAMHLVNQRWRGFNQQMFNDVVPPTLFPAN